MLQRWAREDATDDPAAIAQAEFELAKFKAARSWPCFIARCSFHPPYMNELTVSKSDLPPAIDLAAQPWLMVATANDQKRVQELRKDLDRGEAEAIVLGRADLLLVDERRGRRTASAAALRVTGLLGVVATAKRAGLIDLAKPVLDELIQTARFWIGPELYAEVLAELGES